MQTESLTVAVTGLNATDNPGPGVPVLRALRDGAREVVPLTLVGLAYDSLDPGCYLSDVAEHVYLMPYPSQGAEVLYQRLLDVHRRTPIDVLIPTLDAELPAYLKIADRLAALGIHTCLPTEAQLQARSKAQLADLCAAAGVATPRTTTLLTAREIADLDLEYPVMVKGQFYDAYMAYSPAEVTGHFNRIAAKWGVPVVVQEYVAGQEFDVAAVGDGEGGLLGAVPMRKMQLTDKGKAWGGMTIADAELDTFVAEVMATLKWRGPCELEILRSGEDGTLHLIEINPRCPAWIYLSAGANRNLPWLVVQMALGLSPAPLPPAPPGVMFLRYSMDQICALPDYAAMTTYGELHRGPLSRADAPDLPTPPTPGDHLRN
ncbi:MAG: ATP-grasp domain-containing protein [Bradymonadia bacterium]